ncbi:hypothetical protein HPB52_002676 [Rhipicephalus sanguineus]|uniref:Secreted protein n=1 Tax=Rhipicephalus sanguineus TaxID=34632 RepID=A0A9D4QGV6_RHISA|nr:hypothetical protein HPB52_002676 [Rhipicephalus sanguineus]
MALHATVVVSVLLRAQRACFAHFASVDLSAGTLSRCISTARKHRARHTLKVLGGRVSEAACRRGVTRKPDGAADPLERFSSRQGKSSHERKHKRVAIMEDLQSQRPFGPMSGLNAYLVAGVLGIKSPKHIGLKASDVDDGVSRLYKRPKASAQGQRQCQPNCNVSCGAAR